jgi:molybdopterin-binding protein
MIVRYVSYAMPMRHSQRVPAGEAARRLGISLDTLRRWDRQGRIRTERDASNRRLVPLSEIERIRGGGEAPTLSARNRFPGVVRDVRLDGLLAQVEIETAGPARVLAVITREAAEQLGLAPGVPATALVKATSVMVER